VFEIYATAPSQVALIQPVTRHRAVPILVVERDIRHRYLLFRVMPHTVQLEGPVCLGVLGLEIAKKVCYLI
jgi:hypothetical protein